MKNILIGIIVIALAAGGWYYFSHSTHTQSPATNMNEDMNMDADNATPTSTTSVGTMETGTVDSTAPAGHEDDITVSGFNFGFTPSTITVKKGDHVKITFTNSGGMHDFKIDEFNVATPRIQTGQNAVVEFDATKAGTFQFYCSVGNHRAMGMFGTLTVTE